MSESSRIRASEASKYTIETTRGQDELVVGSVVSDTNFSLHLQLTCYNCFVATSTYTIQTMSTWISDLVLEGMLFLNESRKIKQFDIPTMEGLVADWQFRSVRKYNLTIVVLPMVIAGHIDDGQIDC